MLRELLCSEKYRVFTQHAVVAILRHSASMGQYGSIVLASEGTPFVLTTANYTFGLRTNWKAASQVTRFMGPTSGPPGSCRPQMGPSLAPWTLLSGIAPTWPMDILIVNPPESQRNIVFLVLYHSCYFVFWKLATVISNILQTYVFISATILSFHLVRYRVKSFKQKWKYVPHNITYVITYPWLSLNKSL